MEEGGELALGQDDGLGELVEVHPQQALDGVAHLAGRAGEDLLAALESGLLRGRPVLGAAHDPGRGVGPPAQLEAQADPRLGAELVDDRRHEAVVVVAGHRPVEGEGDGVDHGGLARPGRPDERHQVDVGEVDGGRLAEGAEALHLDGERPHASAPWCSSS